MFVTYSYLHPSIIFVWHFDIDNNESVDPLMQILKYGGDWGQDSDLEPYDQSDQKIEQKFAQNLEM